MNFCLAHAKIQALLKKKKSLPKKSLTLVLHQAIQLVKVIIIIELKRWITPIVGPTHLLAT